MWKLLHQCPVSLILPFQSCGWLTEDKPCLLFWSKSINRSVLYHLFSTCTATCCFSWRSARLGLQWSPGSAVPMLSLVFIFSVVQSKLSKQAPYISLRGQSHVSVVNIWEEELVLSHQNHSISGYEVVSVMVRWLKKWHKYTLDPD